PQRLAFAQQLAEQLLAAFEDADRGGFFFTRHDHEPLIHRPKPIHDGVTASGNGAAAGALLTLGYLIGEPRYVDAAARTVAFVEARSADAPHAACSIHRARALLERPPAIVVLTGPPAATAQWAASLHPMLSPRQLLIDAGDRGDLPPALAKPVATEVQAWLCEGMSCRAPERDLQRLIGALGSS
ncbi:MAG TPA: hypothetical protein VM491_15850, partial [Burkholderiaceae bacterium]|nr:hypothetical protein [Burkholderiaceae bacterium]